MRVSLQKADPLLKLSDTLIQVLVSEIDDPPHFIYSHSFKYKVPLGTDQKGEIIVYAAFGDVDSTSFSFDLERCHNKECKKENIVICPAILGSTNRLLVADVFHTKPKAQALREFGTALFKALFFGSAGQLLRKTEPPHPNSAIYLQLNRHVDLDAIPWEYANDRTIFLARQRIFARVQAPTQKLSHATMPKHLLRIVAVVPDPITSPNEPNANLSNLNLSEQFQNFINGFTKNKRRVKLESVFPPTVSQTGASLDTKTAMSTVLHFMGHCVQDKESDSSALIFEHDETGQLEYVNASQLVGVFKNLRLAFLSTCNSRDIARVLVERGVWCTIGSNCLLPDDLARKFEFEFYKFLANGSTIEMAMYQARACFEVKDDIRQASYLAGAMVLYLSAIGEDDSAFQCEKGTPEIDLHIPPNNLMMSTVPAFRGGQKELAELYSQLRVMVLKGQTSHMFTIKGIGGQEFVTQAMKRTAHFFPGGIFAWAFDKEKTAAIDYFRRLVEVIFSKDIWMQLTEQHSSNVQELGSAIIQQFEKRAHATCMLILYHADILDLGEKQRNIHAMELGAWLRRVASGRVKVLLTSNESLSWCTGGVMDLKGLMDPEVDSERYRHTFINDKKRIHKYFAQIKEPIHFYGVPAENLTFIERLEILAKMEAALGECKTLVLNGLGGMGKTQLMLRYCYLHRAAYNYIFWLEVDSWSVVIDSFRKLAIKLGINEENTKGEDAEKKVIDWVCSWFQDKTHWLLLLNNCDGDEMEKKVFELLPRIGEGDIILTTRSYISSKKAKVIQVDKMQEEEALFLLLDISSMDSIDTESAKFSYAREITVQLDRMPLAIALACAYIKDTATPLQNYLSMLQEKKKRIRLFNYNDDNDYKHTVATVWQLSFDRIRALNPTAVRILEVCAFLQPENIPVRLFQRQYSILDLISVSSETEQDSEQLLYDVEMAVTMLVKFSFVIRTYKEAEDDDQDPANNLLTIHRLVQKVIYDRMGDEQIQRWGYSIPIALKDEIDFSNSYAIHTRRAMDAYISHIRHLATILGNSNQCSIASSKNLIKLLKKTNLYLYANGMYFDMRETAQLSVKLSEAVYGLEHKNTADSLDNLARYYKGQGKYDEAEPLCQRALAISEKMSGPEHRSTAARLNNLALLYENQGKYGEAEPLCQRALAISEKVLGPEHPETATTLNNLAVLYVRQGKYDEAEPLYQRALAINEKVLGPEHPSTSRKLNNLARVYVRQGKYDEAEPLYQRALAINEKVLGPEHPSTSRRLNNLALFYKNQGKYDEAEPLYQRALAINEKVLRSEHPHTKRTRNNLAQLYKTWKQK